MVQSERESDVTYGVIGILDFCREPRERAGVGSLLSAFGLGVFPPTSRLNCSLFIASNARASRSCKEDTRSRMTFCVQSLRFLLGK